MTAACVFAALLGVVESAPTARSEEPPAINWTRAQARYGYGLAGKARSSYRDRDDTKRLGDAFERAREEGRPIVIAKASRTSRTWHKLKNDVWADRRVREEGKNFVFMLGDPDKAGADVEPLVMFADPWGRPLAQFRGYRDARYVAQLMARIPNDFSPIRDLAERLSGTPQDSAALTGTALFYEEHLLFPVSNNYWKRALETPDVQGDPAKTERALIAISMNEIRMKRPGDATARLEKSLETIPSGHALDQRLLLLVRGYVDQSMADRANEAFSRLLDEFPESQSTAAAAKVLAARHDQ